MTTLPLILIVAALAQEADGPRPEPEAIEELLRRQQVRPPIPPAGRDLEGSASTMDKLRAHLLEESRLWPEGHILALRRGRLEGGPTPRFVFTDGDDGPLEMLPNSKLDQMQNYTEAAAGRAVEFRVIGMVTEYRGVNYLLLREVDIVNVPPSEEETEKRPAAPTETVRSDVLDVLLNESETIEPLPVTVKKPPHRSASRREHTAHWPEGSRQMSRPGRILEDGGRWTFVFESASEKPADPALPLLPNLALESMIAMSDGGRPGVVFVVSGDITEYDGDNFMLVRRFSLRRDHGNLR